MTPLYLKVEGLLRQVTVDRLELFRGNRKRTAESLGIGIRTLHLWINKWDLKIPKKGRPSMSEAQGVSHIVRKQAEVPVAEKDAKEQKLDNTYKFINTETEAWRTYTWVSPVDNVTKHMHRIENPSKVVFRQGGSTHRVITREADGKEISTVLPAPGYFGCVIQHSPKAGKPTIVA